MSDTPKLILDDDWKKTPEAPKDPSPQPASQGVQVDSDWKNQASAERERLAAAEEANAAASKQGQAQLPVASFTEMVRMLTTQALMYLGAFPDPETGRAVLSPEMAKFQIDLLGVLQEKTKGNLTQEEAAELAEVLTAVRLQFAEVMKAVEKMMAERAAKGGGMPTAGMRGGSAGGVQGLSGMGGPAGPGLRLS